jgi:hypothetical protein
LLVEALRVEHENLNNNNFCESCGFIIAASSGGGGRQTTRRQSSIVRVLSGTPLTEVPSPILNSVTKPEESFTVTMTSMNRQELNDRPEWKNNDYRMF